MIDKYSRQQALQSPETLATVIHAIIRKQYGDDVYAWDPITVALELKDDFGVDADAAVLDRWCAMQVVMSNDVFFRQLDAFLGICNTLADGSPFFQVFDPVTVEEAAWGITEVAFNRELLPFSYPIKQYLKLQLKRDGYTEATYPAIFTEVFELKPDTRDIRELVADPAATHNRDQVELYIDDQLRDLVYQCNKIPDLRNLDDIILHRSMDEYVGNLVGKASNEGDKQ